MPRPHARLLLANHEEFERLGIPSDGLDDGKFAQQIVTAFGLGPAHTTEVPTATGVATFYEDPNYTNYQGDGRVVTLGDIVLMDARNQQVRAIFEVQVKGIETGLKPVGFSKQDSHGHGREAMRQAIEDAVLADYLAENGVATNRWLAVIDTGEYIEHPDGGRERAGLFVRGGNFFRLAHLYRARHDQKMLREILDYINRRLCAELGLGKPLSIGELYRSLVTRKAHELADLYWARATHGAVAIVNTGLFEFLDHGTASTVDRAHRDYTFHLKPGYAEEANDILHDYYEQHLLTWMKNAATSEQERAELAAIPEGLHRRALDRRMAEHALAHMGFMKADIAHLMQGSTRVVLDALRVIRAVGEQGVLQSYKMGPAGEADVYKPARYNIFRGLSEIVSLYATEESPEKAPETKIDRLERALESLSPTQSDRSDRDDASRLLLAVAPLVDEVLGGLEPAVRREKVRLMATEARRINRPVDEMVRKHVRKVAIALVDRIERGEDLTPIRAELRAMMRRNRRNGQFAAPRVAEQLAAPTVRDTWVALSHSQENGVRIVELSNGAQDKLAITILGNPLKIALTNRYRLHVTLDGRHWQDLSPIETTATEAVFHVPLTAAPTQFEAAFFDGNRPEDPWWNNAGKNFGIGHEFALASPLVDASLGALAERRGVTRPKTPRAAIRAVTLKRPQLRFKPSRPVSSHPLHR